MTQLELDARILALAAEGKGARLIARDLAGPEFWGVLSRRGVADRLRVLRAAAPPMNPAAPAGAVAFT